MINVQLIYIIRNMHGFMWTHDGCAHSTDDDDDPLNHDHGDRKRQIF